MSIMPQPPHQSSPCALEFLILSVQSINQSLSHPSFLSCCFVFFFFFFGSKNWNLDYFSKNQLWSLTKNRALLLCRKHRGFAPICSLRIWGKFLLPLISMHLVQAPSWQLLKMLELEKFLGNSLDFLRAHAFSWRWRICWGIPPFFDQQASCVGTFPTIEVQQKRS